MPGWRVGIDFGTSNSGVGWFDGKQVHLLPIDQENLAPEVVKTVMYIDREMKTFIGQEAISLYYKQNINRPRRFVKKWIGEVDYRGADMFYTWDVFTLVDELVPGRLLQFIKTGLRSDGYTGTLIFDKYYDLKTIIKSYLHELKSRAERLLGGEIESLTLGRPVKFFDDPEKDKRSETTLYEAALAAGFRQVEFELEPVAAALSYEQMLARPETVLVFDFGGGTLDISIMRLGDPGGRAVYANGGIGIAGADFDRAIIEKQMLDHFGKGSIEGDPEVDQLVDAISDWQMLPQLSTPNMKARIDRAAARSQAPTRLKALEALIFNDLAFQFYDRVERAKIELSSQPTAAIAMRSEGIELWELLTRLRFEEDIAAYRSQIETCLLDTLARSGLKPGQIDSVIRTGGSSSIPCFIELLNQHFGPAKVKTTSTFSSVTSGLAIKSYLSR